MKRLVMILAMLMLVFADGHVADCQSGQQTEKITIPFDPENEKQLQIEVDKGHQPWRLEPVAVAHAALITSIRINVPFEKCRLSSEGDRDAIVKCADVKNHTVRLKRLIRAKGIWTATEIQVGE